MSVINIRRAPKGWQNDPSFVYIGRKGQGFDGYFGNPYALQPGEPRGATIERFRAYAVERMANDPQYRERVQALHGKTLVCFCAGPNGLTHQEKPWRCHGQVLAMLAEEAQEEQC